MLIKKRWWVNSLAHHFSYFGDNVIAIITQEQIYTEGVKFHIYWW